MLALGKRDYIFLFVAFSNIKNLIINQNKLLNELTNLHVFRLFLPPCDGRAGKFLLEDRPIRDYPFQDCVVSFQSLNTGLLEAFWTNMLLNLK